MEICILNPFFHPYLGGTEKMLLELYGRLAKRHNVSVISAAFENSTKSTTEYVKGIKVVRLATSYKDMPGLPLPFMEMKGVEAAILKEKADVYHMNNRYVFYWNSLGAIKRGGGKLVLTIHNALPHNINLETDLCAWIYDAAWGRKIMASADAITAVSRSALESTIPRQFQYKARVIINGIDSKKFSPRSAKDANVRKALDHIGTDGDIVLTTGRLVPQKGQIYLIRAFAKSLGDGYDGNLVIIGRGPMERKLRHEAEKLGISDKMRIASGIPEDRIQYYYNAAKMFAFPSLHEPCALALLEALSSALPIITTRAGGNSELAGNTALYVHDRDSDGIKRGIERFLDDPKRASSMGALGRKRILERNNWDDVARQYEECFLSVTKQ